MPHRPASSDLIERLFGRSDQRVQLAAGEVLMTQGTPNERLFRVEAGLVAGYYSEEGAHPQEIFRATTGMFVGLQSFFSGSYTMLLTVRALEATTLSYLTQDQVPDDPFTYGQFAAHFLPIVVRELYVREIAGQQQALERQRQLKNALLQDKMVALGQMAQGLAHELNNAVGVLQSKAEWLGQEVQKELKPPERDFFEAGTREGLRPSSREIRARRTQLQERFGLDPTLAHDVARTTLPDGVVQDRRRQPEALHKAVYYWEVGNAVHDLRTAASHAADVLNAVRELGRHDARREPNVDLRPTLERALTLLAPLLREITVMLDLPETPLRLAANASEWVQVWVNLIKNAAEALLEHGTPQPQIRIHARQSPRSIHVHVIDNGPGIPDEVRETLFLPNFTTKGEGRYVGMGLGLSIVDKIVASYQGRVWVETQPGETAFKVKIPNQPGEPVAATDALRDPNV